MSFIGQRADIQIISYLGEETVDILLHMTSFSVESFFSEIVLDLFSKLLNFIKTFLIPMIIWKIEKEGLQDFFLSYHEYCFGYTNNIFIATIHQKI